MDFKNKYIKYKKKYLKMKNQMGGVNLQDDLNKYTQGFLTKKDLASFRETNKKNKKNVRNPKECIDTCKCKKFKSTSKVAGCEGVCNQHCELNNKSIKIAVREWLENKEKAKEKYGDISTWDTSNVTNMMGLFSFNKLAENFNEDISNWNVSKVKDMSNMFNNARKFNQPLNKWNVSEVKDMSGMFNGAFDFNQPLDDWNVRNVKDMSSMFSSALVFDKPLNNWDVRNVENLEWMFAGAINFNQSLSSWKTNEKYKRGRFTKDMFYHANSMNKKRVQRFY